ncbi:RRQRL motif-containing zinc-binding protein [Streptomyces virginiae]|uniref:RRQRL motif-containing zinc-binding protein n=1 Tax=Streptomyces virginiae TaxID=1961 RepID=UPI0033BACBA2
MPRARRKRRRELKRVPRTDATLPEHDRGAIPEGLLTRRQLRERGLSPGGHDPVAVLRCKYCAFRPDQSCNDPTRGWLYDASLARPKRVPTLAQEWALDRAMAARQTCPVPTCGRRYVFCLPLKTLGSCLECAEGTPADPSSYFAPPSGHPLAA